MNRRNSYLKNTVISIALLWSMTAACGILWAQPARMSPKERAANMKEQLALTDSQAVLVTGIFEDAQADMKKAADSANGDRQSMRDLRMAIMKKSDERIDSILTDDQKKKFADMKKERQGRMRNRQRND